MPRNNFTQIWEDHYGEEWEVQYHFEGSHFRGTVEEPPEFPWIEVDAITSITDGRPYEGDQREAIEHFVNKNHEQSIYEEGDFYGN